MMDATGTLGKWWRETFAVAFAPKNPHSLPMNHSSVMPFARLLLLLFVWPWTAQADVDARVEAILPKLQRIADTYRIKTHTPGLAIAVVTPNNTYYVNSGRISASSPRRVSASTVFQVASVSKAITGTYAARLVTEGKLQWDDRIVDLLPWFRFASEDVTRRVTVLDMLTQRSGLIFGTGAILEDLGYGQRFVLEHMREIDPSPLFRKKWDYVNFGITIGGVAAARTTDWNFPVSISRTLFQPLGMLHTSASYKAFLRAKNAAKMNYVLDGRPRPLFVRDADAEAPAGGVCSTSRDLATLLRVYLNGGKFRGQTFLSPSALKTATSPLTFIAEKKNDYRLYYGVGWFVKVSDAGERTVYHDGTFAGVHTLLSFKPEHKIGIVVLGNAFWGLPPQAVEDAFYQLYSTGRVKRHTLAKYVAPPPPQRATVDKVLAASTSLPATVLGQPLSAYVGTYANAYLGNFVVAQTTSGLTLTAGPHESALPLRVVDGKLCVINKSGDVFFFVFSGFNGASFTKLAVVDDKTVAENGWSDLTRVP
jgi:CubicO group peptidase (beta-lactamase class C family)